MQMGNYTTNLHTDEIMTFYFYVENHLQYAADFNVRVYIGNDQSQIIPGEGILNANLFGNYSLSLENNMNWTSTAISYSFPLVGLQFIGLELYQNVNNQWQYLDNYTLFLRVNVTSNN
jgi:hypothetical protein